MNLHSRVLGSSAVSLLVGASLVVAACGASDDKKTPVRRDDGGSGGEEAAVAGQGGASAGAPGEVGGGGEGGAAAPSGASAREILGLPTEVSLAVVCGAPRASVAVTVFNGSNERVTIESIDVDGPFEVETELPLSIEPGASQPVELKTMPGVVGTDKPGDERSGSLSVVSSVGNVSVALRGTVQGSTVSIDSIPGAPLTTPLDFACSSAGRACPTQSFHIVNTGESPVRLSAPVGDNDVVGAFVPGAPELTLLPGAGVKVELRPGAGKSVSSQSADSLTLAVEGSCEVDELKVETRVTSSEPCNCFDASPGVQAGSFAYSYECSDVGTLNVPLFNGTAETFAVEELQADYLVSVPDKLPLNVPSGETRWLELFPEMHPFPGFSQSVTVAFDGPSGTVRASGSLKSSGSWISLRNAQGSYLPETLALGCGPTTLQVFNDGDEPTQVQPPVLSGGVVTDFTAPQTIAAGATFSFQVSPVSNAGNACATTGNIAFPQPQNNCSSESLAVATTYAGTCQCNGL
jgi:hypothetical protein